MIAPAGSWTLVNETPVSPPTSITASLDGWSQNPRPYRLDSSCVSLRGRTISATQSADTIRPPKNAAQNELTSATVV